MTKLWKAKWATSGGHGIEVEHLRKEVVDDLVARAEANGYTVTRCGPGESLDAPAPKKMKFKKKKVK